MLKVKVCLLEKTEVWRCVLHSCMMSLRHAYYLTYCTSPNCIFGCVKKFITYFIGYILEKRQRHAPLLVLFGVMTPALFQNIIHGGHGVVFLIGFCLISVGGHRSSWVPQKNFFARWRFWMFFRCVFFFCWDCVFFSL